MAKDKKGKKARKGDEAGAGLVEVKVKKSKKKDRKEHEAAPEVAERPHPLEALNRLADHPLVSELLAVGALAAVAAVAEAGARDPAAVRSADAAKKAGKAAAAAIGTRLLKEFSSKKDKAEPGSSS
jgi:hypothetical protein